MKDGLRTMEDYYLSQAIMGNDGNIDDLIDRVRRVSKDEVVAAFNKIEFDTIYFLKGNIKTGKTNGGEA